MITDMINLIAGQDPMTVITGIAVLALAYWAMAMIKGILN